MGWLPSLPNHTPSLSLNLLTNAQWLKISYEDLTYKLVRYSCLSQHSIKMGKYLFLSVLCSNSKQRLFLVKWQFWVSHTEDVTANIHIPIVIRIQTASCFPQKPLPPSLDSSSIYNSNEQILFHEPSLFSLPSLHWPPLVLQFYFTDLFILLYLV